MKGVDREIKVGCKDMQGLGFPQIACTFRVSLLERGLQSIVSILGTPFMQTTISDDEVGLMMGICVPDAEPGMMNFKPKAYPYQLTLNRKNCKPQA